MRTIETLGSHIELVELGKENGNINYAYTVLYKGNRASGNAHVKAKVADHDALLGLWIIEDSGLSDNDVTKEILKMWIDKKPASGISDMIFA